MTKKERIIKYLEKRYAEMPKHYLSFPLHQLTGFILRDGKLLCTEAQAHYQLMNELEFDLKIRDAENILLYQIGIVRIRPEGYWGCCGINVEIFRSPTAEQVKVLQQVPKNLPVFFDIWLMDKPGESMHSPKDKGTSRTEFLRILERIKV